MTPDEILTSSPSGHTWIDEDTSPFASLESAQEYVGLLGGAVEEAQGDIQEQIEAATDHAERRREALYLVNYKLSQLRHHVAATGRLLNDLRMLRRLLLGERSPSSVSCVVKRHKH